MVADEKLSKIITIKSLEFSSKEIKFKIIDNEVGIVMIESLFIYQSMSSNSQAEG